MDASAESGLAFFDGTKAYVRFPTLLRTLDHLLPEVVLVVADLPGPNGDPLSVLGPDETGSGE